MGVTVKNLTKRYGLQTAVDNLNFTAREGEVLGILGPNGAGKTTTLRMIAGLLKPDKGYVHYGGIDIWKRPSEAHRRIGYLPESNPLYLDMYILEVLRFYGKIHKVSDERVNEVLDQVGLGSESNKRVRQLSKGYRQRLGLGIAILHDPSILILDEPISGFDPNQLTGIRKLIRKLAKDKTILFSSHILSEVEQVCDRVMIIHKGNLQVVDSLDVLRAQQDGRQVIVAELSGQVNKYNLLEIPSVNSCEILEKNIVRLTAHAGLDMRKELYEWTVRKGVVLLESRVEQTSMNSLFEKLTR